MQTWTIDFQIIFNWTFDYKFPVACSLKCNGYANPARTVYYNNFLLVENNIDFTGELLITSDAQGELEEGAWVKGGDTIHWSNLSVIYENTDNIYLNNTLITVSISDEDDNVWTNDLTSPGETINITTIMA